jgi:long-chain acyl-CoA synthetase
VGQNANIAGLLRETATKYPNRIGVVDGDRRLTWSHVDQEADALAAGLLQRGMRAGDRVAMLCGNTAEFVISYFAILRAGFIAVPMNPAYTSPEVAVLLADSGARLLLFAEPLRQVAEESSAANPGCDAIAFGSVEWDAVLHSGRDAVLAEAATPADAVALLLFTSGTSGRPKGAMLTHGALRANLEMLLTLNDPPAAVSDDTVLAVLPLFHVYGLNTVLGMAVSVGACMVLLDRFDPIEALQVIADEHVTTVAGAPGMYQVWQGMPQAASALRGVRLFSSGGAPLPPSVLEGFRAATGKDIFEGYGMTETSPVISTTLVGGAPKAGSVGRPLPGIDIRIVDESGDDVEDGDPGELCVRGANVFRGYWPDGQGGPDADGWFRSGDVAYVDADGDLHVIDRRREMILVNGFNVYPREIELAIEAMPEVAEVAVVGIPDDATGEAVSALVVPAPGVALTAEDISAFCATRLARFKSPTVIRVVSELPHSATGKIAKGRLREVYGDDE